ncbi:MAG: DNRLRE domain-containing protein [Nitrospirae bacterium]|nr:DNRLRE domain-containing protein [Nitrospirota bacterium]
MKSVTLTSGFSPPNPTVVGINTGDADLWGIAIHPGGSYAYVAGRATKKVYLIDLGSDQKVDAVPIVGGTPWHVGYTRDGAEAYVSKNGTTKLLSINTSGNTAGPEVDLSDDGPTGVALSPDGSEMYVTNVTAGRVNVVRVQDKSLGTAAIIADGLVADSDIVASADRNFRALSMLGPSEGWAVGEDGRLFHWDGTNWGIEPLATMPVVPPPGVSCSPGNPPSTCDNGDGTWTSQIEPVQDVYARLNDSVQNDGTLCTPPQILGCTNGINYHSGTFLNPNLYETGNEIDRLGLRRVREAPNDADPSNNASPNAEGDLTETIITPNPNKKLFRPYLQFDLGVVKQYALSVSTAILQLRAYKAEVRPSDTPEFGTTGLFLEYQNTSDCILVSGQCVPPAVNDSSGNGNSGTNYGGTIETTTGGIDGPALSFDGNNDRVILPSTNALQGIASGVTVSVWVNFTSASELTAASQELIRKGINDDRLSFVLRLVNGRPAFKVRVSCGLLCWVPKEALSDGPPLQLNHWYMLSGTYDGQHLRVYQDGGDPLKEVDASGALFPGSAAVSPGPPTRKCGGHTGGPTGISSDSLCIGGTNTTSPLGTGNSFAGLMDGIRIYDTGLSQTDNNALAGLGDRYVDIYRVTSSWPVATLSGATQPQSWGVDQTNSFAKTIIRQKEITDPLNVPPGQRYEWDVTRLAQGWVDDTYHNYGLVLRMGLDPSTGATDPSSSGTVWFYSAHAPSPYTGYRPRLTVKYRVSRRPNLASVAMVDTNGDKVADDGWAVGQGGVIFRYNSGPKTWSLWTQLANGAPTLPTKGLNSVSMRSATEGWVVGEEGVIYHFTGTLAGGVVTGSWAKDPLSEAVTSSNVNAVSIAPNGDGIAVGDDGVILMYDHLAGSWAVDGTSPARLLAVKAFSKAKAWGVGEEATIIRKRAGSWLATDAENGTEAPSATGNTHLRGIDMLPEQTTVSDWRENY